MSVPFSVFVPYRRLAAAILVMAIRDIHQREHKGVVSKKRTAEIREDARSWLFYDGAESFGWRDSANGSMAAGVTARWCCDVIDWDIAKVRRYVTETPSEKVLADILHAIYTVYGGIGARQTGEEETDEDGSVDPWVRAEPVDLGWGGSC